MLALFPPNEALMEQAEALDPDSAALLREQRTLYVPPALPPIEAIIERIHARGFAIADALIRAYHVALQTKPLVILPGISGTGKTRLTRLYADAVLGSVPWAARTTSLPAGGTTRLAQRARFAGLLQRADEYIPSYAVFALAAARRCRPCRALLCMPG
ncbi:MAG: hypothetical protein U0074_00910 [Kouleothrix sp.]